MSRGSASTVWLRRLVVVAPLFLLFLIWLPTPNGIGTSDPLASFTDAITGLILVVAGLVAAERRPASRTGPLLILAGYLWYVGDLFFLFPDSGLVPLLSFAFRGYYDVAIAVLLLSFPAGRLQTSVQRLAVVALTVAFLVRSGVFLAVALPGRFYPDNGTPNPFLLQVDGHTAALLDTSALAVRAVLIGLIGLLAIGRWRGASLPTRRLLAPVLVGGAGWAVLSVLDGVAPFADVALGIRLLPWADASWWSIPDYLIRGTAAPVGFLVAALLLRTARSAVVDLVSGIPDRPLRQGLQASLIRVLGDPTLTVVYPEAGGWTDSTGRPVADPMTDVGRAVTPIVSEGGTMAAITHDPALLEDPGLVSAVAATVRLAVDNERLNAALEAQLDEVRASRTRIVEAADAERRRLERDLHDGAQQRLVALAISLRMLGTSLGPGVSADVTEELDAAGAELRAAIEELRELARGLDPPLLREAGLGPALESLAERMRTSVKLDLQLPPPRLPKDVETTAYFLVAEALANVTKHAQATRVTITARSQDGTLALSVADDGRGGADPKAGSGLRGLADRVAAAGGTFDVSSSRDGTSLVASIPCA